MTVNGQHETCRKAQLSTSAAIQLGAAALAAMLVLGSAEASADVIPIEQISHIHDLSVDPDHPERLYLATHQGVFLAMPNGKAESVGSAKDDFMSFAADPANPDVFYASGHPPGGGNLGLLSSKDRGVTWQQVSPGVGGPVDFHAMAVSPADPKVIYGMYKDLQVSRDGGATWSKVGPVPEKTFDLSGSMLDSKMVYAAGMNGLFISRNGGQSWEPALMQQRPTTLVEVSPSGSLFAFIYGVGLVQREESAPHWSVLSSNFGQRYIVKLAFDPRDPDRIHVVADTGGIVTSKDGGRNWVSYMGHDRETPEFVAAAGKAYEEYCQSCHGKNGVGERPQDMHGQDEYGYVAPPLDNSSHGWHHSDDNLAHTILNGSERNPRMMAFKDIVSEQEARNTVAYIKSLWNFNSLACQGALHMRCMH